MDDLANLLLSSCIDIDLLDGNYYFSNDGRSLEITLKQGKISKLREYDAGGIGNQTCIDFDTNQRIRNFYFSFSGKYQALGGFYGEYDMSLYCKPDGHPIQLFVIVEEYDDVEKEMFEIMYELAQNDSHSDQRSSYDIFFHERLSKLSFEPNLSEIGIFKFLFSSEGIISPYDIEDKEMYEFYCRAGIERGIVTVEVLNSRSELLLASQQFLFPQPSYETIMKTWLAQYNASNYIRFRPN